jgi:hypothetical protein
MLTRLKLKSITEDTIQMSWSLSSMKMENSCLKVHSWPRKLVELRKSKGKGC